LLEGLTVHEHTLLYGFNIGEIHSHQLYTFLKCPRLYF
jgi:hypothetical protein